MPKITLWTIFCGGSKSAFWKFATNLKRNWNGEVPTDNFFNHAYRLSRRWGLSIGHCHVYQSLRKREPRNTPKPEESLNHQHQHAPTNKTFQKTLPGRVQTCKNDDGYSLSAVFSEAQKGEPKWSLREPNIAKTQEHGALKKPSKTRYCKKLVTGCILASKRD